MAANAQVSSAVFAKVAWEAVVQDVQFEHEPADVVPQFASRVQPPAQEAPLIWQRESPPPIDTTVPEAAAHCAAVWPPPWSADAAGFFQNEIVGN